MVCGFLMGHTVTYIWVTSYDPYVTPISSNLYLIMVISYTKIVHERLTIKSQV